MAGPQPWHAGGQVVAPAAAPHGCEAPPLGVELRVLDRALVSLLCFAGASPALDLARERVLRQRATAIEAASGGECAGGLTWPAELLEQRAT
jgi:hypothetical protein